MTKPVSPFRYFNSSPEVTRLAFRSLVREGAPGDAGWLALGRSFRALLTQLRPAPAC